MNVPPPPALDRTPSAHSRYTTAEVWCFERQFEGQELRPPVRIIIFDCDETLTLSTFLPHDDELRTKLDWTSQWEDYIATMNFESPFLTSSRRTLLREMLEELCKGNRRVQGRQLAVLTRNNSGAIACLNLLRAAQLDQYFSAVWGMHHGNGAPAGVYKSSAGWKVFEPPFGLIPDHKAHVLHSIAECPSNWFPQLAENALALPSALRPEEILLVDDVRTNFQSGGTTAKKVFRCCKVARYDAPSFRDMGFVRDMGGIGAHNEEDYKTLVEFANRPWAFNVDCKAYCLERTFEGSEKKPPVKLILFDFDGALTLYTFMPEDPRCSTDISYAPNESAKQRYVQYNFETPYLEGSRVERLASLLKCLAEDPDTGERRVLAILTINEAGAIAVLNVLRMAGLSDSFSVIWTLSTRVGQPGGAYSAYSTDNNSKEWKTFTLPQQIAEGHYKASVIESILASPSAWFPQLSGASPEAQVLTDLCLPNIVLVDDERNICRLEGEYQALRHCRVASYDDEYRDQGLLWHMGGLGAKCLEDYQTVLSFVRQPWQFAEVQMPSRPSFCFGVSDGADHPIELQRSKTEEDLARRLPQFLKTKDLQELARPRSSTVD